MKNDHEVAVNRDKSLDRKVLRLQKTIESWAKKNKLWSDCGFFDYTDRRRPVEWDPTGYVTVLAADGPLAEYVICGGHSETLSEFDQILAAQDFWYENFDHTEMWIYATGRDNAQEFKDYMHWKWVCSLVKAEFDSLDEELYAYIASPGSRDLSGLGWRDFEKLIAALMESQGYQVELGCGTNDGGVDLRLLQRDPIGDIMTLVQVKRYRSDRKIRLGAVQALHGATVADGAERSMFVTTSDYLPSARKFAERKNVAMTLCSSEDIRRWCADAHRGIVTDKKKLVSSENIDRAVERAWHDHSAILHSQGGYDMVWNSFAVTLKETRTSALLLELPTRIVEHDGYSQRGREVPDLRKIPAFERIGSTKIRRARRIDKRREAFRDDRNFYTPWNGESVFFDHCD